MSRTDAVLFDLDGTLCRHDQDGEALLQETFERVGIDPFTDQRRLREAIVDAPDADGAVPFLTNAFDIAADRADAGQVPARDVAQTYVDLVDNTAVHFREGAEAALESVGDRPLGLVTNGERERQRKKLRALGIEGVFDAIVYGGDTAPAKPSPEPFETVLGDLDVAPEGAVHVGNSLTDDVAGANRAGVRSVWVPTEADRLVDASVEPVHTLEGLDELPTVF